MWTTTLPKKIVHLSVPLFGLSLFSFFITLGCKVGSESVRNASITITEGTYEERHHFIVTTKKATYYLDSKGGGFSRLIDTEGNDWIGFKKEPWGQYPESAASAFRGMPNLVHGGDDSGAGHPGHDKCISKIVDSQTIAVESVSGLWQWQYTFYDDHVKLSILKADPNRTYWFLYEGIPGGRYDPSQTRYGTSMSGPQDDTPDFYTQQLKSGHYAWTYFSHLEKKNSLFIIQREKDTLQDTFSYLGNSGKGVASADGMTVMGFGRNTKGEPLLKGKNVFLIGFFDKPITDTEAHLEIENHVVGLQKSR